MHDFQAGAIGVLVLHRSAMVAPSRSVHGLATTGDVNLFKAAARNYELEREYRASKSHERDRRRDADRDRRAQIATYFLADPNQRAMVHPSPAPQ
jgi:hypothetical protein